MSRRIDLDATENCPLGARCESCGIEATDLQVQTADLGRLGVACFTLCPPCGTSGVVPPVTVSTAMRLVGQHAAHLGLTLDEAAEVQR